MTFKILNTFILILAKLLIGLNFSFANDIKLHPIVVGKKNAPIVIKEYFSLTCSHCASFHKNTYPKVKKELIDTGKVKFEFLAKSPVICFFEFTTQKVSLERISLVFFEAETTRSQPNNTSESPIGILGELISWLGSEIIM